MDAERLRALINGGEGPRLEFKRDDVRPESLAREVSALMNFEGGYVLLGVEDDGAISGLTRSIPDAEEWVMNVLDHNMDPRVGPNWECVEIDGKTVGVIGLPADAPSKPYKARAGRNWVTYVRLGSTTREARREEEGRLYQASRQLRYDIQPVPDTGLVSLDMKRLYNYMTVVLGRDAPDYQDEPGWTSLLTNIEVLSELNGSAVATVAGLLLFGKTPNRRLPQAGITATAYPGLTKDYDTVDEDEIRGPLVSTRSPEDGSNVYKGVIDHAVDFVMRNVGQSAWLESARRVRFKHIPEPTVREAIVNAVAHRDYTYTGADVEVSLYADRLEVISPGRLPNGVTVAGMSDGQRNARNETLKDVLRDYDYVEYRGLGVRRRLIEGMREHNGTAPDLIEQDTRFKVRLHKGDVEAHRRVWPDWDR